MLNHENNLSVVDLFLSRGSQLLDDLLRCLLTAYWLSIGAVFLAIACASSGRYHASISRSPSARSYTIYRMLVAIPSEVQFVPEALASSVVAWSGYTRWCRPA